MHLVDCHMDAARGDELAGVSFAGFRLPVGYSVLGLEMVPVIAAAIFGSGLSAFSQSGILMNATPACAANDEVIEGHSIGWAKAHRTVRKLQARIVKTWKAGRYNKAKALQWLLTHSFSGRALAVKRVTENHGKNTPGIEQATWSTPEAKSHAMSSLSQRGDQPQPLWRVYSPKPGKPAPIRGL
jgi:hypothetical protein